MKIVFEGWEVGMRKIPFIKLLKGKAGLSLSESKRIKDGVVNGEIIEINIKDEELAKEMVEDAKKMGVKARIIKD